MTIKKVINAGLFLTCLVMCLSGCGKTDRTSDTAERSVIKLGSDSYPPYNYLNEDGVVYQQELMLNWQRKHLDEWVMT